MKVNKIILLSCIVLLAFSMISLVVLADCTILAVGKDATVNGTAMITHNDDSSSAAVYGLSRKWIGRKALLEI